MLLRQHPLAPPAARRRSAARHQLSPPLPIRYAPLMEAEASDISTAPRAPPECAQRQTDEKSTPSTQ